MATPPLKHRRTSGFASEEVPQYLHFPFLLQGQKDPEAVCVENFAEVIENMKTFDVPVKKEVVHCVRRLECEEMGSPK